jgi:hypothetical protein
MGGVVSREWKPGDVAQLTLPNGASPVGVRNHRNDGWSHSADWGGGSVYDHIGNGSPRPLVVIDPEDHEQVERLLRTYYAEPTGIIPPGQVDALQTALRSLVADPKPDEPQGLGAVVEDAEGKRYVRYTQDNLAPWRAESPRSADRPFRYYKDLTAVYVLSEGVS